MKGLERIKLLEKIGSALQSKMTFTDIDQYLKAYGIDLSKHNSGRNSKRIYAKEMLDDSPEALLFQIADELGIEYENSGGSGSQFVDSRYWTPGYFRLFLSHISEEKIKATAMKNALKEYAISGFVAHEDIHPTREWQHEIENALFSMDALAACLTPKFHESKWTDQEIGFALGRTCLVISVRIGLDPYGFFGKLQGIQAKGKKPSEIARMVFNSICDNPATRTKMFNILVEQIMTSSTLEMAIKFAGYLEGAPKVPSAPFERLRDNLASNPVISNDEKFVGWLNGMLVRNGLQQYVYPGAQILEETDIPF